MNKPPTCLYLPQKTGLCLCFFFYISTSLAVYPNVPRLAGYDLLKLCLEGPEEQLEQRLGGTEIRRNLLGGAFLGRTFASYWVGWFAAKFGEMIQFD